jgi:hypothetical protein
MAQGGDIVQLLAVTLFKSVGTALVNLTAAVLAYQGLIQRQEIEARIKKS